MKCFNSDILLYTNISGTNPNHAKTSSPIGWYDNPTINAEIIKEIGEYIIPIYTLESKYSCKKIAAAVSSTRPFS